MSAHRNLLFFAAPLAVLLAACPPPTAEPSNTTSGVGAPVGDPASQGGPPPGGPEGGAAPPPDTPMGGNADQPCGDGVCDDPETQDPTLCPRDCQEKPAVGDDWCGDGICDALESDKNSCPDDCLGAAPGDGGPVGPDGAPGVQPSPEGQPIAPEDVPSVPGMDGPPPEGAPDGAAQPPPEGAEPPPEGTGGH